MSKILDFISNFAIPLKRDRNFVLCNEGMSQKKEVRKMKKFLGLLLVFGLMSGVAFATTNPDNVQLTVTVGGTIYSVDIASTTNSFGTVGLGAQSSLYIGSASNDGNVGCDWEITGINAVGPSAAAWTLAAAVGADNYGLMFGTSAVGGAEPVWNPGATPQLVSSVTTGKVEPPYGNRIIAGAQRGLWARLSMPTSSAQSGTYSFTISINADPID